MNLTACNLFMLYLLQGVVPSSDNLTFRYKISENLSRLCAKAYLHATHNNILLFQQLM